MAKPNLCTRLGDLGTPELRNHHTIVIEQTENKQQRAKNITQTPLDWYFAHSHITQAQWKAGNRIYDDFIYSGRYHMTMSSFTKTGRTNAPFNYSDRQLMARKRFYNALDRLEKEGENLIVQVCCYGQRPHEQDFSARYAIARLRSALEELAYHYGIGSAKGGRRERQ
jgi:hypothetical protein